MADWESDTQYEEYTISSIEQEGDGKGWAAGMDDGFMIYVQPYNGEPRLGDRIRLYGEGFGRPVRGIAIAGRLVRYQTDEEMRAEHARQVEEDNRRKKAEAVEKSAYYKEQYDSLPDTFKRRIDRFRSHNPDFWWEFEPYELSCCVDAVKIAAYAKTGEGVKDFHDLPWDEQKAAIPDLFDGHSGNSFGFACRLAHLHVEHPKLVTWDHGALAYLVGCDDYGCPPPTDDELAASGMSREEFDAA